MTTHMEIAGADKNDKRSNEIKSEPDNAEVSFEIPPFGIAPDARMIFEHPHFEEVRKGLINTIMLDNGFGVVTGEVGSGKTTLLHRVIADLPKDFEVAMIMNTCLKPDEFLLVIADDLGIKTRPEPGRPEMQRRELLSAIGTRLDANFAEGRKTIIIIDEAQHLTDETLELVRMLSNLKSGSANGVRFLLFGQEQLRERLLRPELQAFVSRIGAQYHLNPLTLAETESYVRHRLVASRPTRPVTLSDKAVVYLHRSSSGLPRRINIVAGNALMLCLTNHRRELNTKDIIAAAKSATLPFDRRMRERHYTAAAGWVLFFALSAFGARQYVRNIGHPAAMVSMAPTVAMISPAVASIPPPVEAEIAPLPATEVAPITAEPILPPEPVVVAQQAPTVVERVEPKIEKVVVATEPMLRARRLEGNMRGPDVTRLQLRLTELGYFKHAPTDKFGGATATAVLAFQKDQGISEQGAAGPLTFAALYRTTGTTPAAPAATAPVAKTLVAVPKSPAVIIIPTAVVAQARTLPAVTVQTPGSLGGNSRGPEVTRLQMRLAALGYFKHAPTEKFGGATAAAVLAFQKDRGIREYGAAGPLTLAALYGTVPAPPAATAPVAKTLVAVPKSPAVRIIPTAVVAQARTLPAVTVQTPGSLGGNSRGPDVTRLQMRLATLGYFKEPPTEKFGRATLAAMLAFQKDRGIPEHGVAGPLTVAALYGTTGTTAPLKVPEVRRIPTAAVIVEPEITVTAVPAQTSEEKPPDAQ